jgi:hypothetical protein
MLNSKSQKALESSVPRRWGKSQSQETLESKSRRWGSYDLLWLSLALLPLVGLSFLMTVPAQDYWWYLRLGQDILKSGGTVPAVDTMSWSRAGLPIFYQQWLSGLLFWGVYSLGGAPLTFLLRGLLLVLAYGLTWGMIRSVSGPRLASILTFLLGLASSNNWVMRPQLFVYPLFVLCLWTLYRWQAGHNKTLWLLPLATLLWVNLHGSFILPLVLAGAALVFGTGARKPLLIAVLAMVAATLINPHGFGVWGYLAFILQSPSDQLFSVEWRPPSNLGWQMNLFFGWLLLFPVLAAFSPRKLSRLEWVWFLGFGWLALSGTRYGIWFLFLLAIFTASLLAEWTNRLLDRPVEKVNPRINIALSTLILLFSLLFLPGLREAWWTEAPPLYEESTTPIAAVDWLQAHPDLRGPLWNDYAFGSYLAFALPSRPISIDTRMYSFPPAQWDEYVRISGGDENGLAVFDQKKVNLLLLATASQFALIENVQASPAWCEQYRDENAVIFARCEALP